MVATNPSEDTELPTTRLWMTSVPCLGLILRCPSFYTFIPFYGLCFPLQTITAHIPLYDYISDVDANPYVDPDSFLLFFVVLLNSYSHDITFPLFLLIHLSHDPAFCLLIIPTLLLPLFFLWIRLLRVLTHIDSIVVQIPDVIYDVMTTPVYKIPECGRVTPQLWYLGKSSALLCLSVIKDKSELNE